MPRSRKVSAQVLLVATCLLLIAATLAAYAARALFDSDRFADRAAAALQDAARCARRSATGSPTSWCCPARPTCSRPGRSIAAAVGGAVGGDAFAGLFRRAVRDAHGAVFQRDQDTVDADAGRRRHRRRGRAAPARPAARRTARGRTSGWSCSAATSARRPATSRGCARDVRVLALVLAALALGAALAAVAVSPDRRGAAARVGVGRDRRGHRRRGRGAARPGRRGGPCRRRRRGDGRACGTPSSATCAPPAGWWPQLGAVLAAAATAIIQPVGIERPLRAAWRWLRAEPQRAGARIARAAVLIAAGALVVAGPEAALRFAATARRRLRALQGRGGDPPADRRPAPGSARRACARAGGSRRSPWPSRRRSIVAALGAGFVAGRRRRRARTGGDHALQRPRRPVRPAARRDRAPGHAQLHVGPAAGLVRGAAGAPDRRPARGRHPRPAVRHPLRRPARERPHADVLREPRGVPRGDRAGRGQRPERAGGRAPARPARLPRRGRARHVPVPHVLRARRRRRSATCSTTSTPFS